jgi:rod shape-determining protein MreD
MTPRRIAAALAIILTALVLQATLVAPLAAPFAISLPAVSVACVALVSGPGTGISLGFSMGLLADLGSNHPAGLLAFLWLAVGIAAGLLGSELHRLREGAIAAGLMAALASVTAVLLLLLLHQPDATLWQVLWRSIPTALGDSALALLILPVVRVSLSSDALRRPPAPSAREWVGTHG